MDFGVSMFMTTDGPLVNHYVEEERPPPATSVPPAER